MTAANTTPGLSVEFDQPCLGCGYSLRGLSLAGRCPECGKPVEDSLKGNLLRYSGPEYVGLLYRGVVLIQASIVAQILMVIGSIVAHALVSGLSGGRLPPVLERLLSLVEVPIAILSIIGWWLLSSPDPAFVGTNSGSRARSVVRVTVAIRGAAAVLPVLIGGANTAGLLRGAGTGLDLLVLLVLLASWVAWVVWFFAAMRYLSWLAPRLPNERVEQRANRLLWLNPLLYTVGSVACGIGPLIAWVLYYNLLDWIRKDLRSIRESIAAAQGQ